jgi:hypothetical protein
MPVWITSKSRVVEHSSFPAGKFFLLSRTLYSPHASIFRESCALSTSKFEDNYVPVITALAVASVFGALKFLNTSHCRKVPACRSCSMPVCLTLLLLLLARVDVALSGSFSSATLALVQPVRSGQVSMLHFNVTGAQTTGNKD